MDHVVSKYRGVNFKVKIENHDRRCTELMTIEDKVET